MEKARLSYDILHTIQVEISQYSVAHGQLGLVFVLWYNILASKRDKSKYNMIFSIVGSGKGNCNVALLEKARLSLYLPMMFCILQQYTSRNLTIISRS